MIKHGGYATHSLTGTQRVYRVSGCRFRLATGRTHDRHTSLVTQRRLSTNTSGTDFGDKYFRGQTLGTSTSKADVFPRAFPRQLLCCTVATSTFMAAHFSGRSAPAVHGPPGPDSPSLLFRAPLGEGRRDTVWPRTSSALAWDAAASLVLRTCAFSASRAALEACVSPSCVLNAASSPCSHQHAHVVRLQRFMNSSHKFEASGLRRSAQHGQLTLQGREA